MLVFAAVAGDESKKISPNIDETLFYRISAGNKDAFCTLYEQTASAVYAYALSLLHNQRDAEDAMQETYLKIRSAAHLYHGKADNRQAGQPIWRNQRLRLTL